MVSHMNTGAHFITGLSGTTLAEREKQLLAELKPSGIILFAKNIDVSDQKNWPEKLIGLIQSAKDAAEQDSFIVSIDHEGGRVHRLPAPCTRFPAACNWGLRAGEVGAAMAKELHSLGINLDFAPVLDIHSEPLNSVIGVRAFGTSPADVIQSAKDFLNGLQLNGVLGCGKHFPGHGATLADSHFELPVLNSTREELLKRELVPFKALMESNLQLLMTAHILLPRLDREKPASISKIIIHELLRQELGYNQAVITDALEMKALSKFTLETAVQAALEASTDLLLIATPDSELPLEQAARAARHIELTCKKNKELERRIEESKVRLKNLKAFLSDLPKPSSPQPWQKTLGRPEHQQLCSSIEGNK